MKKLLFISLFLFSNNILSQDIKSYYFGIGVNACYAPLKGLNDTFRQYQAGRQNENASLNPEGESWLNNLADINVMLGPSISFGYAFKPEFNLEFKYMDRSNSRVSQVLNTNGSQISREFNVKSRSFGFGVSRLFATGRSDYIIGGTFNATQVIVDVSNTLIAQPINQANYGATVFVKYIFSFTDTSPFAIVINPYYQYHFTPIDFSELNRVINPKTFSNLSSSELQGARSYFGIEIQLNYFVFTGFQKETIKD